MDPAAFRFLGLLCLVHLYQAEDHRHYGGNCSALIVHAGERIITDFPCVQYDTQACISGPASFPEGVRGTASAEDPQNFSAAAFRRVSDASGNLSFVSGIKCHWRIGPLSPSSRGSIKGYYLHVFPQNGSKARCSLLDLRGFDFKRTEGITFEMTIFPFTETDNLTYAVQLRSLPLAADAVINASDPRGVVVCVPGLCGYTVPGQNEWTPAITTRLDPAGSLDVRFHFSERVVESLSENYRVTLMTRVTGGFKPQMAAVVVADNTNGSFGGYLFSHVPIGEYKIVVAPMDNYPDDGDLFQCYAVGKAPLRPGGQCMASCVSATTKPFIVPETHLHLTARRVGSSTSRAVAEADGAVLAVVVSLAVSLWAAARA